MKFTGNEGSCIYASVASIVESNNEYKHNSA